MSSNYSAMAISFCHMFDHDSLQSTRALLCLGMWSTLGLVKDSDVKKVTELQDVEDNDAELADRWDEIIIS